MFLDPVGPFRVKTHQGDRFALFVLDDFSRVVFCTGLPRVADWFSAFSALITSMEADKGTGCLVSQLVTDSYPAFVNCGLLRDFLLRKGIRALHSPPYTQKFNLVERTIRTIEDSALAMMRHGGAPKFLAGFAILTAVNLPTGCRGCTRMVRAKFLRNGGTDILSRGLRTVSRFCSVQFILSHVDPATVLIRLLRCMSTWVSIFPGWRGRAGHGRR